MRSSLSESVIVTDFQATETYSCFDLIKAKYTISKQPKMEKENVVVRINPRNFSA
jgi:hypothetical protein